MSLNEVQFHNRRAVQAENRHLRVTVSVEGGHVAEILHKPTGVNPLWLPPWPSIEPSTYDPAKHPEYGTDAEARLLAGILGHNLCLDTFGSPSAEEAAAGIPVHGEAPVATYQVAAVSDLTLTANLDKAQLLFERRIHLTPDGRVVKFSETLENLSALDRPVAWTQHVTLGPPFLEPGRTQFRIPATKSKVIDSDFNDGQGSQPRGAEFDWPLCPAKNGGSADLRLFPSERPTGGFTAHLMDPAREQAWFLAWSPETKVLFGYVWKRADFPWLARWEENHLRQQPPWNGRGLACGMEFGVSPMVESRREMVTRASLFGVPTFRWVPARTRLHVNYCAFITTADRIPESVTWDGEDAVDFET
jgi:hypothetical protein